MEFEKLNLVVALAVVLLGLSSVGSAEKARALFVFGDSYADTGNHNPYDISANGPWRRPYGFTWPGYPAGRYSSGKVQTDRWAEILGLPTPIAFERLRTHNCEDIPKKIAHGVNFAYGGSGILEDYGDITVAEQVEQFKGLIKQTGVFGGHELARSVLLLCNVGNDYLYYLDNNSNNVKGLVRRVRPVVGGMGEVVKELHKLGFRNFVVSNVIALGCVAALRRTSCDKSYDGIIHLHSRLLHESMQELRSSLDGINIIIPDLPAAYNHIFSRPKQYGFEELFQPCCAARGNVTGCADVDDRGAAMFEMCEDVDKKFFWDNRHPTHKGWLALMSLYTYGSVLNGKRVSFVGGTPNLLQWVESLGFEAHKLHS